MKKLLITLLLLVLLTPLTVLAQINVEEAEVTFDRETQLEIDRATVEACENAVEMGFEAPTEDCDAAKKRIQDNTYVAPVKNYTIPFLPKPDGVPGFEAENREDPEEARQYFLQTLLPRVTQVLIGLIAIASFVVLLYAGTMYFTTFGDEDQAGKAKNAALYAIVGLIVAVLSFAIVQLISSLPFQ